MFGSTLPDIFDKIHSSLHEVVQDKVSTLPIIQHDDQESCETKLYSKITTVYTNYMDVAQLYAENELFTLDKSYSRRKRERIVNAFLALKQDQGSDDPPNDAETGVEKETETSIAQADNPSTAAKNEEEKFRYTMPSSSKEIPSVEEMNAIDEEIAYLRKQLREYKVNTHSLHQQTHSLEHAFKLASKTNDSLLKVVGQKSQDSNIIQDVQNATEGKRTLTELNSQAEKLVVQMDEIKAQKGESNETQEFGDAMKAAVLGASRPRKKMTLEEDYQERIKSTAVSGDAMKLFEKRS